MRGPPDRARDQIPPLRLDVRIRAALEQQSHDIEMIAEDRIEKRGLTVSVMPVNRHIPIEHERDDRHVSISGAIPQGHLAPRGVRGIDELPYEIQASDSGRPHQANARTTLDE